MIIFLTRGHNTEKLDFVLNLKNSQSPTAWHREVKTISKHRNNAAPKYVITSGAQSGISNPFYAMTYWM